MTEIAEIHRVSTERIVSKIAEKLPESKVTPNCPIGMFDSGVGGLTVLKAVMKDLPKEDVIYFADTARVPYGSRPPKEILNINHEIIDYLIACGAKLIVIACGTSSSIAYPVLKDKYKVPMVAIISPGSREAVAVSRNGRIGVIATMNTIESGSFQQELRALKPGVEVFAQACPLFVPLIEGGFADSEDTKTVAKEYLKPLIDKGVDTLILGCTHYAHLRGVIEGIMGGGVAIVDPAETVVKEVKDILAKRALLSSNDALAKYTYVVSGSVPQFEELGTNLLRKPIVGAKKVTFVAKAGPIE